MPERPPGFRVVSWFANRLAMHGGNEADPSRLAFMRTQAPQRAGLELALLWPDIVTLQSVPGDLLTQPLSQTLGMRYTLLVSTTRNHGAAMTRHSFGRRIDLQLGSVRERRTLFPDHWSRISFLVDGVEHVVHSVQLHDQAEPRAVQVDMVLERMRADLEAEVPLIFQGTFNHGPEAPEYGRWIEAGLIDAFAAKGTGAPFSRPWEAPEQQLDHVFVHGASADCLQECRVVEEDALCGDPDDPTAISLSPRRPILTTFA